MRTRGTADRLSPAELGAWQGLLRAGARLDRLLDADLKRLHGLSASDYDVLIQLGMAPQRRLRMTALADQVLMSPSGVSRLVDDLEGEGLVVREQHKDDARSFEVVLTPAGRTRLRAANRSHLQRARELFLDQLSDGQLHQLVEVWNAVDPTLVTGDVDGRLGRPQRGAAPAEKASG